MPPPRVLDCADRTRCQINARAPATSSSPAAWSRRSARASRPPRSAACWSPAGLKVALQKFDPYINIDPGTMSPFQHGEVFVTEDGAETDLDLGHYERFTDANTSRGVERDRRRDLQLGDPQGAPRRLPRRHRPGRPAHHRRDQAPHPAGRREPGRRHRDHRDRRHGGRHRVAAVPGGDPAVPGRRRPAPLHVHPPHARAVHRPRGRAEDQADAALGQRAAPHRHPARHGRVPLRGRAVARHPQEDRAVRLAAGRGGRLRARRRQHLQGAAVLPGRGRGRLRARPLRDRGGAARPRRAGSASSARRRTAQERPPVRIALVGKYVQLEDAYLSVVEALRHSGFEHGCGVEIDWVDSETLDDDEVRAADRGGRRDPDPRRLRRARDRGQDRRGADRARAGHPVPRRVPGHADGGGRVRAPRRRHGRRELERVRPRDAVPGGRPAARAEGGRRHGRHDAARGRSGEAAPRHAGARDLRRGRRSTSATGTATRSTTSSAAGSRRPAWSSPARRRTSGWSRSSSCPTTRSSSRRSSIRSSSRVPSGPAPLFREFVGAAQRYMQRAAPHELPESGEPVRAGRPEEPSAREPLHEPTGRFQQRST